MPIAKLVSADGPVDIYYELQGRISTNRDDFSYTKAAQNARKYEKEPSSLSSTAGTDPELGRVKGAVDSAAAADRRADTGKRMLAGQSSRVSQTNGKSMQGASIELTDMSGKEKPAVQPTNSAGLTQNGTLSEAKGDCESPTAGPESADFRENGVREDEHVIQMPHEETTEASSRQGSCTVVLSLCCIACSQAFPSGPCISLSARVNITCQSASTLETRHSLSEPIKYRTQFWPPLPQGA